MDEACYVFYSLMESSSNQQLQQRKVAKGE
jgi:hypothetical protein